jgi:hypothetical protein
MNDISRLVNLGADLRQSLEKCWVHYGLDPNRAYERLTSIPRIFFLPSGRIENEPDLMQTYVEPDDKAKWFMADRKRYSEIESAKWECLTKGEKRSASSLTGKFGKDQIFQRQGKSTVDVKLALFLLFTFEEMLEQTPWSKTKTSAVTNGHILKLVVALTRKIRIEKGRTRPRALSKRSS